MLYDLVLKNIEKLTKRSNKRKTYSEEGSSFNKANLSVISNISMGLSESQVESLYTEFSPDYTADLDPNTGTV